MLDRLSRAGGGRLKKLEEAARLWASGAFAAEEAQEAHVHESANYFGLVFEGPVLPQREEFYLWPEHADAWRLFMECQTEWRGSGQREGLCKEGVERIMRALRMRRRQRERFLQLRVLERSALAEWARLRNEEDQKRALERTQGR